jgi:hypothetical protein
MLDLPVPEPGPPGPYATMAWLRVTVSRFANGDAHARRRAIAEARLATLDPDELAAAASDSALPVDRPYLPVAMLATATGVVDVVAAVAHTRVVAAAYHPGTDAPGADEALAALLALLPPDEPEALAQHVGLLVQACEATAGLVRGDNLPVKTTKRVTSDGTIVAVDLTGRPFGEGPRRCPGERHARALAEALR